MPDDLTRLEALRVLNLPPSPTRGDIKRARNRLLLRHHPDKGGSAQDCHRIQAAYDCLISRVGPELRVPESCGRDQPSTTDCFSKVRESWELFDAVESDLSDLLMRIRTTWSEYFRVSAKMYRSPQTCANDERCFSSTGEKDGWPNKTLDRLEALDAKRTKEEQTWKAKIEASKILKESISRGDLPWTDQKLAMRSIIEVSEEIFRDQEVYNKAMTEFDREEEAILRESGELA